MTSAVFQVTGTYTGLKAPAVSGIAVLINNQVVSYTGPAAQGLPSPALPFQTPLGITGDLTNGVAVFSSDEIAYLSGVGVTGAKWYTLPALPNNASATGLCGDLLNGLVATDGTNVYILQFNGPSSGTWSTMAAVPTSPNTSTPWSIGDISGDPTNGILLVMAQKDGPSSLFWGTGPTTEGCSCAWVAVVQTGSNLPVAKVNVQYVCGNYANGFIIYGDSQVFSLTSMKNNPATATAVGTCSATLTKLPSPPFTLSGISGDPVNGSTALGGSSGLIATTDKTMAAWVVVSVAAFSH